MRGSPTRTALNARLAPQPLIAAKDPRSLHTHYGTDTIGLDDESLMRWANEQAQESGVAQTPGEGEESQGKAQGEPLERGRPGRGPGAARRAMQRHSRPLALAGGVSWSLVGSPFTGDAFVRLH